MSIFLSLHRVDSALGISCRFQLHCVINPLPAFDTHHAHCGRRNYPVKSFSFTAALSSLNLVQRLRRKNSLSSFHPNLESLSERTLPSAGSISGYVYQDVTG